LARDREAWIVDGFHLGGQCRPAKRSLKASYQAIDEIHANIASGSAPIYDTPWVPITTGGAGDLDHRSHIPVEPDQINAGDAKQLPNE
jgi:hypothetical protein